MQRSPSTSSKLGELTKTFCKKTAVEPPKVSGFNPSLKIHASMLLFHLGIFTTNIARHEKDGD